MAESPKPPSDPRPVTKAERQQVEEHFDRRKARHPAPYVKRRPGDGQLIGFDPDHPCLTVWKVQLEQAFGTVEPAFAELLLNQLIEAIRSGGGPITETTINGALSCARNRST
jgi:hypothetical protein